MNTFASRLLWARTKADITQDQLAARAGVSQSTIGNLESGLRLTSRKVAAIASVLGVSALWLSEGRGLPFPTNAANVEPGPDVRGMVPVVSWVTAGAWAEVIDLHSPGVAEEWRPCPRNHGDRTFALRVRGVSMENLGGKHSYSDGDIIFVDPDRQAENGSRVVVRIDNDREATFKQLVIEGDNKYLRALNPAWPNQIIRINGNATICGVVIGKWTDE